MIRTASMLTMLLFLLALTISCMGFQQASEVQDLASMGVPSSKIRITQAMQTIIKTMHQVDKLPSCQKMASQALLNTCSEIDHASSLVAEKGVDVMLERSKSIYATRLAICELMDANADIPASCSPFRPMDRAPRQAGFRGFIIHGRPAKPNPQHTYEDTRDLDRCSLSLSSNPVWWTSYSNARQNAVLLCHSMRAELDKDDMIQKMKLMFDAVMEAADAMSDTTEEYHVFEESWREMGKSMESFHLALNSNLEMQKRTTEQWAQFRSSIHELDNNIRDLGRGVDQVREVSSRITSDLEEHRIQTQAAHSDVTQHLSRVLDIAMQIGRSQDNSLSTSLALDQHNQELSSSLARNVETAKALNQQTQHLLYAIFSVTENVTDAARTVSEFREDINSLPAKVLHQVFQASIGNLPIGLLSVVILSLFWSLCFAAIDTWGPFRTRGSAIASLGLGIACTYLFFETPQVSTLPAFSILGIVAFAFVAIFSCKLWYIRQAAWKQPMQSNKIDQTCGNSILPQTSEKRPSLEALA